MKRILLFAILIMGISANMMAQTKIRVSVNGRQFTATLADNETARELLKRLPVTLRMSDVNGNEKYAEFEQDFPGARKVAGDIHAGDLKIWSGNGLVLFYKSFHSGYSYYDLGSIDNPEGLQDVVSKGSVEVTFSLISDGVTSIRGDKSSQSVHSIYTLDGRRVAKSEAKDGIFIVDGKKIKK
jgi:hypothetical protein